MPRKRIIPGDPKRALAYLRASTDEQQLTYEAQHTAIESWAARESVYVAAWYVDQGVSGATTPEERPKLAEALAGLRAHRAGLLVVAKRDRIARDAYVALTIEKIAEKSGARLISADGAGNGLSPSDELMRLMLDGFAQFERKVIRGRIVDALAVIRRRGNRIGGIPYGYQVSSDETRKSKNSSLAGLEPNPKEQQVLARARELKEQGFSQRAIAKQLAAEGMLSREGTPFHQVQIHRMLTRPT